MTSRLVVLAVTAAAASFLAAGPAEARLTAARPSAQDLRVPSADPGRKLAAPGGRAAANAVLAEAKSLISGRGIETGRELTPVLAQLSGRFPSLDTEGRASARRLLARPTDVYEGVAEPTDDGYTAPISSVWYAASEHFCFWWVTETADAPDLTDADANQVPDYVDYMAGVFEQVYAIENSQMGWKAPKPDNRGPDSRMDVYVKDLNPMGAYGYAASDPGQQTTDRFGYQVMDNDYVGYGSPPDAALKVTAAHEYNHALQFSYYVLQDKWQMESTSTWMEEQVYPEVNDYLNYLGDWALIPHIPLTSPVDQKVYGDAVWNHWLTARYGPTVVRRAQESIAAAEGFSALAYEMAIDAGGGSTFAEEFARFAAATAAWNSAPSVFPDHQAYPAVNRRIVLRPNHEPFSGRIDHTGYYLMSALPEGENDLTVQLEVRFPRGVAGAIAMVGNSLDGGPSKVVVKQLPRGGKGSVKVSMAGRNPYAVTFTGAVINADANVSGWNSAAGDWDYVTDGAKVSGRFWTPRCLSAKGAYEKTKRAYSSARKKYKRTRSAAARRRMRSLQKKLERAERLYILRCGPSVFKRDERTVRLTGGG